MTSLTDFSNAVLKINVWPSWLVADFAELYASIKTYENDKLAVETTCHVYFCCEVGP